MSQDIERGKVGASFEDFLKEQGTYESTTERAAQRVDAFKRSLIPKPSATSSKKVERPV